MKYEFSKGDWCQQVKDDKEKYEISFTDEDITNISKEKYKNMIKSKIENKAVQYLKETARSHSKSKWLINQKFEKQQYLSDRRFTKEEVQLLFSLRTKTVDCKSNFKNLYGTNLTCRICDDKNSLENEDHILTCKLLNEETHNIQFTDVYGTIEQQYKAVQMFKKILRKRTFLLIARN